MPESHRVMDSYIVRIYRRVQDTSKKMLGVVAGINGDVDQPFTSPEELWHILKENQNNVDEHKVHRGEHHEKRK